MSKPSMFIGIDPGVNGGLCVIAYNAPHAIRMPATEWDVLTFLRPAGGMQSKAVIEAVASRPLMGVRQMFTFGRNYGAMLMVLAALEIPFETVHPQVWQRALGVTPRRKDETTREWKDRLRLTAQRLFPLLAVWKEPKEHQLAVADALLIARYCQRINTGVKP